MRTLCLLLAAAAFCAVGTSAYCVNPDTVINVNGDELFNRCFVDAPPRFGTVLAKNVAAYIGPNQTAAILFFTVVLLPFFYFTGIFGHSSLRASPAFTARVKSQFAYLRLHVLNLLHRTNYSLCGTVMLYTIFRQRRPCACPNGELPGPPFQVGSIYGFPSGDSTHAGVIGAFLIDQAPGHPIWSRVFGLAVMALVAAERLALGWHSLGQVITGLTIGVASHYYSTRAPQFMVFVDAFVMVFVGMITVNVDHDLDGYQKWDDMNIRSWFTQGLGFMFFTVVLIARHYYLTYTDSASRTAALKAGLYRVPNSPPVEPLLSAASSAGSDTLLPVIDGNKPAAVDTPTGGDEFSNRSNSAYAALNADGDWRFTVLTAFACFWLTLAGYVVEQNATYA